MNPIRKSISRQALRGMAASILWLSFDAAAAEGGCIYSNTGNYQIGQGANITVRNSIPPGTPVRDEKARGDGTVLATCRRGAATFKGAYVQSISENLVPLTVNTIPSGFGIELRVEEAEGGVYEFPHEYQRSSNENFWFVRSNEAAVGYKVIRMSGPVAFGRVDQTKIAEQWSYDANGIRTRPFREMKIYELYFVRPACSIEAADLTQTVDVGAFNASNFATPDRATPWKEFRLTVQECEEPVGLIADVTFGVGADADPDDPTLYSLSGPENVGLEIGDEDKNTMEPGKTSSFNGLGTGKDYVFNVRLRETKPTVRGGRFSRPVRVTVNFR